MTRGKRLIIGAVVLLVLVAGIVALSLWPEEQPETVEPSPSVAVSNGLVTENQDNVASILFTPKEGTAYTLRRDAASGDCELSSAEAIFAGKQSIMRTAYSYATSLTYPTLVTENATDEQIKLFGLDKPVMTWKLTRTDGTTAEYMVGSESATGKGRYARKKNDRVVYLLSELQSSYLTKTLEDHYELSFVPFAASTEDDPTWQMIEYCLIERENGNIELNKRSEEELAEVEYGLSTFYLTQPNEGEGNDYTIEKSVLEPITTISPDQVEEAHPTDLSVYGLDKPVRLALTDSDGWSGTLLIGRYDAERNGRYVMIEGYDAVLFDSSGNYGFINVDYTYLRSQTIWLYDIKTVSSLSFEILGVSRALTFEHNLDEETLRGWLDDKEITELNARRLYTSVLRIAQDGGADTDIPSGAPDYKITMHFMDGGSDTLELYPINELQYLIVRNGENLKLFINRTSLRHNFLNKLDMLDRGEDLPRF